METFGETNIRPTAAGVSTNVIKGTRRSPDYDGIAESITVYIDPASPWIASVKIKCVLFERTGVNTYTYVALTEERDDGGSGWQTFKFLNKPYIYASKTYAIEFMSNGSWYYRYETNYGDGGSYDTDHSYTIHPRDADNMVDTTTTYSIYCSYTPTYRGDLNIRYSSMSDIWNIECRCSRWDVQDYSVVLETWLTKSELQTLRRNIRPNAVGELYKLYQRPIYKDKTWKGDNTIYLLPRIGSQSTLKAMREPTVMFVKSITTTPVTGDNGYIDVKIEGFVSGNRGL